MGPSFFLSHFQDALTLFKMSLLGVAHGCREAKRQCSAFIMLHMSNNGETLLSFILPKEDRTILYHGTSS